MLANQVADADTGDPPDLMTADVSFTFTTADAAPTVVSTSPLNNDTVGTLANVGVTFSEQVTVGNSWFQIVCATSGTHTTANSTVSDGPTTYTIDPNAPFAANELCTVTVFATQVADTDLLDPPDTMATNYVFSFTTDAAPTVTSTTPANGATGIPNDTNITVNFSEPVNFAAIAFTIQCPTGSGALPFSVSGTGTSTAVLDPTDGLPANVTCMVSAASSQVTDVDTLDPPNTLAPNGIDFNGRDAYVFSFTTIDAPPSVTSTVPANGATGVLNDTNITLNFSEPINFTAFAFEIRCPFESDSVAFGASGNGTSTVVLDPTNGLPVGATCTVTATSSQVTDVDTFDPPNTLVPNGIDFNGRDAYVFSFTTVDAPPRVTSTTPGNGENPVSTDTNITITFNEPDQLHCLRVRDQVPVRVGFGRVRRQRQRHVDGRPRPDQRPAARRDVHGVTATSSQVTDVDTFDPPNTLVPNGDDSTVARLRVQLHDE